MKMYWLILLLGMVGVVTAQHGGLECDCPSCREKAASGKEFPLPGLQGLEESTPADPAPIEKAEEAVPVQEEACCPHEDEHAEAHDHDSHEGHDHGDHDEGDVELSAAWAAKVGIEIHEAEGGSISQTVILPAEIKLNRDTTAAVSPRFPSIVRKVFAEIGDEIRAGDKLAELENRETMAVYSISAPLNGVVITKDLAVGEVVGDGEVLFEIADLSTIWDDINVFPRYQHVLRKGMQVSFIAHDGHTAAGSIKYISPIVSHESRTFTARCVLEGADEDFTPGAFVRASIHVDVVDADVVIPQEAVQNVDGESVVFVPGDHGFVKIHVQTGITDGTNVEIRSGLKSGDPYVASGAFALKAQMITSGMDPHAGHGH
jgi:cobalt-zinc-cadmium efflux system membrane fusion protein